jgi:hypothetical protein
MVLQAIKDHIFDDASNYATRWLAELPHVILGTKDPSQFRHFLLTLLFGL